MAFGSLNRWREPLPTRHSERMPIDPPVPTDPEREADLGRIALWLDEADLSWLSHHCSCAEDADDATRDRCGRIRFRASAALHKARTQRT